MNEEIKPPEIVFNSIWAKARDEKQIPHSSSSWVLPFIKELGPEPGIKILEAGCGTGRISLELSRAGAQCTLLDFAPGAIEIATKVYSDAGQDAEFTLGDLFHMPYLDGTFDVVWNTGVLEHFDKNGTAAGLREMCRVCKNDGKVVVAVPSTRGLIYRLGKWRKERLGVWQYGYERPIRTLRDASPPGYRSIREYQIGITAQTWFWPFRGKDIVSRAVKFLVRDEEKNNFFSRILGGYLLVSVFAYDNE